MTLAQLGRAEADACGAPCSSSVGRDRAALRVVGEHVGEADERGLAVGVVGVVALDRPTASRLGRPQRRARTPPTSAWSTPSSRRSRWMRSSGVRASPWTWPRVARVGVHQDELADVVQQRGDQQRVAVLVADLDGRAGRRRAGWRRACRRKRSGAASQPGVRSKKSKVRARAASASTASGERSSTASTTDSTLPRVLPSTWLARRRTAITSATSDSTAATTSPGEIRSSRHEAQHAVARLGQRREGLERLEGGRQATAVAFVVAALGAGGLGGAGRWA